MANFTYGKKMIGDRCEIKDLQLRKLLRIVNDTANGSIDRFLKTKYTEYSE